MEIAKRQFLSYHSNGGYEGKKAVSKTWILQILSTTPKKNWVDWISADWGKISQPRKCEFLEKGHER